MIHLSLFVYTFSFGMCFAALALCIACWIKEKEVWEQKTVFFIIYFTFLFFLEALFFYMNHILEIPTKGWVYVFLTVRDLGYSLLLYFLGSTLNYLRKTNWTRFQLFLVIFAALLYFAGGVTTRILGTSPLISWGMSVLLFGVQAYLLINSAQGVMRVVEVRLRIALIIELLVPLIFLPLMMIFQAILPDREALNFLLLCTFYFWLSLGAIIYFLQPLALFPSSGELNLSSVNLLKYSLTQREEEIIRRIDRGLSYKEIAGELNISPNTVSNHISRIYRKTRTRSKVELLKKMT